jgi:hypothetical protein
VLYIIQWSNIMDYSLSCTMLRWVISIIFT